MSEFDVRMAQLSARFVLRAAAEETTLRQAVQECDWVEARRLAHSLSGSAAMFGFPQVGSAAQALEEAIDNGETEAGLRLLAAALLDRLAAVVQPD